MKEVQAAIQNLETISSALEKACNRPEFYNSDYSYYLEQMSWAMYRQAQELKSLDMRWG